MRHNHPVILSFPGPFGPIKRGMTSEPPKTVILSERSESKNPPKLRATLQEQRSSNPRGTLRLGRRTPSLRVTCRVVRLDRDENDGGKQDACPYKETCAVVAASFTGTASRLVSHRCQRVSTGFAQEQTRGHFPLPPARYQLAMIAFRVGMSLEATRVLL